MTPMPQMGLVEMGDSTEALRERLYRAFHQGMKSRSPEAITRMLPGVTEYVEYDGAKAELTRMKPKK